MSKTWRVKLSCPVPIYKQLPSDNSCGPRVVMMVADYFENDRGRKLFAYEWSRVLEITMNNNLVRDAGTSREDLIRGLSAVGLSYQPIRGRNPESSRVALRRALERDHPVIVCCSIPYAGEPARHYMVLVEMDEKNLYFADPFPHKDTTEKGFRIVPWSSFQASRWVKGSITWGRDRWAMEILFNKK